LNEIPCSILALSITKTLERGLHVGIKWSSVRVLNDLGRVNFNWVPLNVERFLGSFDRCLNVINFAIGTKVWNWIVHLPLLFVGLRMSVLGDFTG
jgi:hypothetical protein